MITKKYSPKGKSCRVTFTLPIEVAEDKVAVLGDFNNWDPEALMLKVKGKRNPVWTGTISLKPGNTYQFRYLADGERWFNDDTCDSYVPNEYGGYNCVIEV